jgi:asparagine synthase (glutamine-hydrolysing)
MRGILLDTLCRETITQSGIFAWPAVERMIGKHLRREENFGYHLWGMVLLFTWMKHWNIQAPSATQYAEQSEDIAYQMAVSL